MLKPAYSHLKMPGLINHNDIGNAANNQKITGKSACNGHDCTGKRMRCSRQRGLEPGRAAVMPAGTAILIEALTLLDKTMVQVSDAGLLEGILIQHL